MITRKTVLNEVTLKDSGIFFRLELILEEDGKRVYSIWHRSGFAYNIDPSEQISAVNTHLHSLMTSDGNTYCFPPISAEDEEYLRKIVAIKK